jgi:hypothetical protein
MITSGFLYLIYGFLYVITAPLRAFSDIVLSSDITGTISTISAYLSAANAFVPIDTLLAILAIEISVEVSVFLYKTIMWIARRFPTQS